LIISNILSTGENIRLNLKKDVIMTLKHHIRYDDNWPNSSHQVLVKDHSGVTHRVRDFGGQGGEIDGHRVSSQKLQEWKRELKKTGRAIS